MKEMLAPIPLKDRYLVAMYGNDENGKPKAPDKVPAMVFFKGCKGIIEDIQEIQHDENNPNDCAKEPHEITHSVDACRYFAINRKLPAEIVAESPVNRYNDWLATLDNGGASATDYDSYMCGGEPTRSYIGVA
jgi:phage terminase large subunit